MEYVKLSNGTYLTKHDAGINGRNNAREATDRFDKMGDLVDDKVRHVGLTLARRSPQS